MIQKINSIPLTRGYILKLIPLKETNLWGYFIDSIIFYLGIKYIQINKLSI